MKQTKFWGDDGCESAEELDRDEKVKKIIVLAAMLIIHCAVFSQGYIGASVMNKGVGATAGVLVENADIAFNVQFPITELTVPTIVSLSVGRMINLTNDEENNYSITPAFGVATSTVKTVVPAGQYNKEFYDRFHYETLETVRKVSTYYSLEVGKDAYMGRVFIKGIYSRELFFGMGMRLFFNR